ncbi:MAG: hypothetical protein A2Y14_00385 [Verrucomicrobia bacterium GWF2_51_19]|nr:MAG: hypothetical protein A2Y14_00385 [Verrucomicrobia bacterium GWF2_51_19]HCJ12089.1 hypothetical protein [Opitutae bacterium]
MAISFLHAEVLQYKGVDFSQTSYSNAVEGLFSKWERSRAFPQKKTGRVALKIFTARGIGLATSKKLIRGVVASLHKRGFFDIVLVDLEERTLRQCGFCGYNGQPYDLHVRPLEKHWKPEWFYDSHLPSRDGNRKSSLPTCLMFDLDFWIDLPVIFVKENLGISGSLMNGSLWAISNAERFLDNEINGAVAVAEINAIPELLEKYLFSVVSLEYFQIVDGGAFNAQYTHAENTLLLADNRVLLDFFLLQKINAARAQHRFPPLPTDNLQLKYAERLRPLQNGL